MGTADFTPFHSLAGGLMMASSLHTLLSNLGMVLGISGFFHTTVKSSTSIAAPSNIHVSVSRFFILGLLFGGAFLGLNRDSVERGLGVPILDPLVNRKSDQTTRVLSSILFGSLVGIGTKLGNGCTSGHFLCGLSRFSLRSLVATMTFFGVAVMTHLALTSSERQTSWAASNMFLSSSSFSSHLPKSFPTPDFTTLLLLQIPAFVYRLAPSLLVSAESPASPKEQKLRSQQTWAAKVIALAAGIHFSFALGISGMLRPSKVLGFLCLSPQCFVSGAWDPSLVMVAIGGIIPASYAYFTHIKSKQDQLRHLTKSSDKDISSPQKHKDLRPTLYLASPEWRTPSNPSKINLSLVVGAALFGVGWGATGFCPGPAIVSLSSFLCIVERPSALIDLLAFVAAMGFGGSVAASL